MKKLQFTKHLLDKIKIRKISKSVIIKAVKSPNEIYYDLLNKTNIAIKRQRDHLYMVAFSQKENVITIITTHPIKEQQIRNRIKNKRWIKILD